MTSSSSPQPVASVKTNPCTAEPGLVATAADPWRSSSVRIKRLTRDAPDVFTVELAFTDPSTNSAFHFAPGQFNMLYVPGVGEAAISIAGQTASGGLLHTIRAVGSVTRTIQSAVVGFPMGLRGPFGTPWPVALLTRDNPPRDLVIAAGGIGLAPLRALVETIVHDRSRFGRVAVLLGARTAADLLYRDDYDRWRDSAIDLQLTVDRADEQWHGQVGVVTLLLDRLTIADPVTTLVMTCGPEVMMRYVAQSAIARHIPQQNIWVTLERNMNCAIGLCGHCQLGPEFMCKDGPVFNYERVAQWLSVHDL